MVPQQSHSEDAPAGKRRAGLGAARLGGHHASKQKAKANAGTEFARANVFEILNWRYEGGKHLGLVTVVASNEPPSVLGEYLASRFMARREGFFTVRIDDLEDQRR